MDDFPPIASPTYDPPRSQEVDVLAVARAQKWALWAILASIVALFLGMTAWNVADGAVPEAPEMRETILGLMQLVLALFVAFTTWNLASALKIKWAWLAAFLSLFSIIGLIVLWNINEQATRKLRAAGFKVGLLGAKVPRRVP